MTLKERIEKAKANPTKLSKAAALCLTIGVMATIAGATLSLIFAVLIITWPLLVLSVPIFILGLALLCAGVIFVLADTTNQVWQSKK